MADDQTSLCASCENYMRVHINASSGMGPHSDLSATLCLVHDSILQGLRNGHVNNVGDPKVIKCNKHEPKKSRLVEKGMLFGKPATFLFTDEVQKQVFLDKICAYADPAYKKMG